MTVNRSVREQQLFERYFRHGIPLEAARRWAREDAERERRLATQSTKREI